MSPELFQTYLIYQLFVIGVILVLCMVTVLSLQKGFDRKTSSHGLDEEEICDIILDKSPYNGLCSSYKWIVRLKGWCLVLASSAITTMVLAWIYERLIMKGL